MNLYKCLVMLDDILAMYDVRLPTMYNTLVSYARARTKSAVQSRNPVHRLFYCAMIANIAKTTNHVGLRQWAHEFLIEWIDVNVLPNGCCRPCLYYDDLAWQTLCLIFIHSAFADPYFPYFTYRSKYGCSIRSAVYYLIPYVTGDKLHIRHLRSRHRFCVLRPCAWNMINTCEVFQKYRCYDPVIDSVYRKYYSAITNLAPEHPDII